MTIPLVAPYAVGPVRSRPLSITGTGQSISKAPTPSGGTTVGAGGKNFLYEFVLTDLFNPVAGWIPFVPVQWLGLAALGCVIVRFGWPAVGVVAVAAGYELLGASAGPLAGWQLPARYLVVVLPFIAIPMALLIQTVRPARFVFLPLLAVSLVFAVAAVHMYQGLYPVGVTPRIFGARTTAPLFAITRDISLSGLTTGFKLTPGYPPPKTGTVKGGLVVARPGRNERGFMLTGPYSSLEDGTYQATFSLAATGATPGRSVAAIEVTGTPPSRFFARQELKPGELGPRLTKRTMQFKTPGGYLVETRVYYYGNGTVKAGPVSHRARLDPRSALRPTLAAIW